MTLIFGKATVAGKPSDDVFANLSAAMTSPDEMGAHHAAACGDDWTVALGGPWFFYHAFRKEHGLTHLRVADVPEIAIKSGASLLVPLVIGHGKGKAGEVTIEVQAPSGWKVAHGEGKFALPEEDRTDLSVEVTTPDLNKDELKKIGAQEVLVRALVEGKPVGEVRARVSLRPNALAQ